MDLKAYIRDIPDFPKKGIIFKDITPLLSDNQAFSELINQFKEYYQDYQIDYIAGIEARGFIIAAPLAIAMGKGFIPIRKIGKLPADVITASYDLEYGQNQIEIHQDSLKKGDRVLLIDDLLATGGTVKASIELIEELGGKIVSIGFLFELLALQGREVLKDYDLFSLIQE